ncbi:hypothetical protein ACFFMM_21255 [Micromonospora chaiyaphumensis]|uniref:Uncharacterized protein n=1 Tax=Micromonospora chaiyaphumensis TaxID=307119 RepID=A0A1C4TYT9_9ACTN|nr:hypothetical protein [Micromonospora chaiyaphumensis]SCE64611.1 hypothetical protein GA0070214_101151 [Micromonospora chaiyaphumensis]
MAMWHPPTPAEQELWNAVVAGVRAADGSDLAGVDAAVDRLARLPHPWAHHVLGDTAALLVEELDPEGQDVWPLLAAHLDDGGPTSPATRPRGASPYPGGRRPAHGGEPESLRQRLLLIARLADATQVGVGAFLDVALAENDARVRRAPSRALPHCRLGQ